MTDNIRKKIKISLLLVDLLLVAGLFMLFATWLAEHVILHLGPVTLSVSWGMKPKVFFLVFVVIRIVLTIVGKNVNQPVRGCIGHPAVGPFLLGVVIIFFMLFGWGKISGAPGILRTCPGDCNRWGRR